MCRVVLLHSFQVICASVHAVSLTCQHVHSAIECSASACKRACMLLEWLDDMQVCGDGHGQFGDGVVPRSCAHLEVS